jgi:acyl-CoA synthetase (AMP-forming)/AMP-acid ligase II
VVAALACWLAGATLVSIPPVPRAAKRSYYGERLGPALDAMGCSVVVGGNRLRAALAGSHVVLDPAGLPEGTSVEHEPPAQALVQFTSGSTGAPRGVAVSGAALVSHLAAIAAHLELDGRRDRSLSWLPLAHDMGLVGFFLTSLFARVPLTLQSPGAFVRNPRGWLRTCARLGTTITGAPDFALRQVVRSLDPSTIGDLACLRVVLCGGERIGPSTLRDLTEAAGPAGLRPGAIMPVYGMAEATLAVTMPALSSGARTVEGVVGVGPPLGDADVRVDTVTGEIQVRSPWLFDGYWTSRGFEARSDPWLSTRDVGFLHDGELHVVGRMDEAHVVRGRNVYAEDIESILLHDAPGLAGAAAWSTDSGFGLAVEVTGGVDGDGGDLARDLAHVARVAYGVRIGPIVMCRPLTIPRTTSGKPIRSDCRRLTEGATWPRGRALVISDPLPGVRARAVE